MIPAWLCSRSGLITESLIQQNQSQNQMMSCEASGAGPDGADRLRIVCSTVSSSWPPVTSDPSPSSSPDLPAHLLTCPPAHLPICPPSHLPTCPPAHLSTCSPAHLPICPPSHLLTCSPAHLLTCPPAHLSSLISLHHTSLSLFPPSASLRRLWLIRQTCPDVFLCRDVLDLLLSEELLKFEPANNELTTSFQQRNFNVWDQNRWNSEEEFKTSAEYWNKPDELMRSSRFSLKAARGPTSQPGRRLSKQTLFSDPESF